MRLTAILLLALFAGPALAAPGCGAWTAGMEEDEGGPRMAARVCSGTGDTPAELVVQCFSSQNFSLRYLAVGDGDFPPDTDLEAELRLAVDGSIFVRKAHLEAMDAAMVMETPASDQLVQGLTGGKALTIDDPAGRVPKATFSLSGSKAALARLRASCAD